MQPRPSAACQNDPLTRHDFPPVALPRPEYGLSRQRLGPVTRQEAECFDEQAAVRDASLPAASPPWDNLQVSIGITRGLRPVTGAAIGHDAAGKAVPSRNPGGREVIRPGECPIVDKRSRDVENSLREFSRRGRAAMLIGHDAQFIAGRGEAQHRLEKIVTELAVDPCGAQNDVMLQVTADRILSCRFAAPIGADRTHRIAFQVRSVLAAIEHVIGRDVHHRNAGARACGREHSRADFIAAARFVKLGLREIDLRVGGRIHHEAWLPQRQRGRNRGRIDNIGLDMRQRAQYRRARGSRAGQLLAELAVAAKHQDHAGTPRRSPP